MSENVTFIGIYKVFLKKCIKSWCLNRNLIVWTVNSYFSKYPYLKNSLRTEYFELNLWQFSSNAQSLNQTDGQMDDRQQKNVIVKQYVSPPEKKFLKKLLFMFFLVLL